MDTQRLSLMVDMLDELATGRWYASRIGFITATRRQPTFLPDLWIANVDHPLGACGCAIGFACLDSRFTGLNLHDLEPTTRAPSLQPGYPQRLASGWDAVCVYFGLEDEMARWLFGAEGNPQSWAQVRDWLCMVLECAARDQAQAQAASARQRGLRAAG